MATVSCTYRFDGFYGEPPLTVRVVFRHTQVVHHARLAGFSFTATRRQTILRWRIR